MSKTPVFWRLGTGTPPVGAHIALVPGAQAPLLPLELPDGLRGMARERVAERQLVEQLSTPAGRFEMQPFLPKGARIWSKVLVADAAVADGWRQAMPRRCKGLLPDYLALPVAPGLWSVKVEAGIACVRTGPEDGFSAEPELAQAILSEAAPPRAVLRLGAEEAALDAYLERLDVPLHSDAAAAKKAGFAPLRWGDAAGGIDLSRPPSAVYDRLRTKLMRWRVPVVFAVLGLAAWLGSVVLETRQLQADAARDRALMQGLVREHFVPAGPILDVRAQVSAALEAALGPKEQEVDRLPALTQFQIAAQVLTRDGIRLETAAYRADTGLVTTVEAVDFATLDQLIADLDAEGFGVAQLDSRSRNAGGVVARLGLELR